MASSLQSNDVDNAIYPRRRRFQTLPLISDLLQVQERRRRNRNSGTPSKKGPADDHETDQPSLDSIQIPSCTLFAPADEHPFLTKLDSLDGRRSKNRTTSARARDSEPSLPTVVHPPATPPRQKTASSPFTPTRSILKSPSTPGSREHTSPADTKANTTRNILLTANGSPNISFLRRTLASVKRRNQSLPSLPYLQPEPPDEKEDLIGAIVHDAPTVIEFENNDNEGDNSDAGETDSPLLTSVTASPDQKKTVRFDHVDIHPYIIKRKRKSKKRQRKHVEPGDDLLVGAEDLRALFSEGVDGA